MCNFYTRGWIGLDINSSLIFQWVMTYHQLNLNDTEKTFPRVSPEVIAATNSRLAAAHQIRAVAF